MKVNQNEYSVKLFLIVTSKISMFNKLKLKYVS